MRISRHWVPLIFLAFSNTLVFGCDCALNPVSINPADPTRNDIFVGKAATLELRFRNESTKKVIDVFPEPPLTIHHSASGENCEIDGGIWVRKSVYLSADEKILLVQEFSGSNDELVFYETTTCKKLSEIDVSGTRWKIANNQISIGHQCSGDDITTCRSVKLLRLNESCTPIQTKTEKIKQGATHDQP